MQGYKIKMKNRVKFTAKPIAPYETIAIYTYIRRSIAENSTKLSRPKDVVHKSITALQAANATLLFEHAKAEIKALTTPSAEAITSFIRSERSEAAPTISAAREAIPWRLQQEEKKKKTNKLRNKQNMSIQWQVKEPKEMDYSERIRRGSRERIEDGRVCRGCGECGRRAKWSSAKHLGIKEAA